MRKQTLASKLVTARTNAGLSRTELSARTDVPVGTLYNWESTRCLPTSWTAFARVADELDIKFSDIVPA